MSTMCTLIHTIYGSTDYIQSQTHPHPPLSHQETIINQYRAGFWDITMHCISCDELDAKESSNFSEERCLLTVREFVMYIWNVSNNTINEPGNESHNKLMHQLCEYNVRPFFGLYFTVGRFKIFSVVQTLVSILQKGRGPNQ